MVRLQLLLARAGECSRRHAEDLIRAGRVRVNGNSVTRLGTKADPGRDVVTVDGRRVGEREERTTLVLNKPDAVMTTMRDPEGRKTVHDLVREEPFRLVPIGRLDFHTEGVLLLTNDGELASRLLHPRYHVAKAYWARVGGHPSPGVLETLRKGVDLDDGRTRPAVVDVVRVEERSTWLEIIVTEGRTRLIRRMCDAVSHRPLRVVRVSFATFGVEGLRPGQYRYLDARELGLLYAAAGIGEVPPVSTHASEVGSGARGVPSRSRGALPTEATSRSRVVKPPRRPKKVAPAGPKKAAPLGRNKAGPRRIKNAEPGRPRTVAKKSR